MDFEEYRRRYVVDPPPRPRFAFVGVRGLALFYEDYEQAVGYFEEVLGPPIYVEGTGTKSWAVGETWLTLLRGNDGNPRNVEVPFVTTTPQEADRLQRAFIAAGGTGPDPFNTLMGVPVRYCPVTDPLGVELLVYCPLPTVN